MSKLEKVKRLAALVQGKQALVKLVDDMEKSIEQRLMDPQLVDDDEFARDTLRLFEELKRRRSRMAEALIEISDIRNDLR